MNKDNINNYVKIIGNIFLDLNIWKGISARTQFGLDYGNAYNRAVDGFGRKQEEETVMEKIMWAVINHIR